VNNLTPVISKVTLQQRQNQLQQKPIVIWLTGFSGAGKTTIAQALEQLLYQHNYKSVVLDGDNVRGGLNNNLSFSEQDRTENIRRIAEVAKLFCDNGLIVISSFITPLNSMRKMARSIIGEDKFVEVFVNCPIEVCEQRDVKGLYKKARTGEIKNFTGMDAGFEIPEQAELIIDSNGTSSEQSVKKLYDYILSKIKLA
jgi:adenylylsulfate kinase